MATFPKLDHPVLPSEVHVVLGTLDAEGGQLAIERAVRDGFGRPFDIGSASIEPAVALYVPFWRVETTLDGLHIDVGTVTGKGGRAIPVPTGAARFREVALTIAARASFPYEARLPSLLARASGAAPIAITHDEMIREREVSTLKGEVVDADIDRDRAEKIAWGIVLASVSPLHAVYRTLEPQVRNAAFCLYPVYYARYRYEGEARRHRGEELFVAVSGITSDVIAAKHPSTARAVAAKVRRFLSFDRR